MSYNQKEHKLEEKKIQKRHFKKKWVIAGLILVAMLAGGVTGYFVYVSFKPIAAPSETGSVTVNQSAYEAQKLANNGDTEAAITAYDKAIKESDDPVEKSAISLSKANLFYNKGDYDGALVIALEAELIKKNSLAEQYIAQIYEQKKDFENATKYYQSAINLIDASDLSANSDVQYYQSKIDSFSKAAN